MAEKENISGLKQEAIGFILLAFSLYVALSLFPHGEASNLGGVVGDVISWVLLSLIGYTSYIFPVLLLAVSLKLLLRRFVAIRLTLPIGFGVFILTVSALLAGIGSRESGGAVGDFIMSLFEGYMGAAGSVLMLLAVAVVSIIIATRISVVEGGKRVLPQAASLVNSSVARIRDARKSAETPEIVYGEERAEKKEKPEKALKPVPHGADKPGPTIVSQGATPQAARGKKEAEPEEEHLEFSSPRGIFKLPSVDLLDPVPEKGGSVETETLLENSRILSSKLRDFGIEGRVLEVRPGPVVTMYEFEPAPGVKIGKITNLSDDLALAMKATSIRIIAPIPGKSVVGIEVPNHKRESIVLREIFECQAFQKSRARLSLALGKDISGNPAVSDLSRMPHLLIAGATGAGKSVSLNAMILSILFKETPEDVRFLMVDPKMLELNGYEGIPHLITPVITDPKKSAVALRSIVSEMGRRYKLMAEKGAKNIEMYNRSILESGEGGEGGEAKRLPYIIVVIDELADLMMTSGKDVEECLVRLSQMARASGIHLIVATQRPSVDVVTGLIKTNFPSRIAFQLPSRTDSRTILDTGGAETLLGEGDMLFLPPGTSKLQRIHGAYVSEAEIKRVVSFWKKQGAPSYEEVILDEEAGDVSEDEELGEEFMKRYEEAVELASTLDMISTSYLQRRFRIGYNTAARLIEKMEKDGIVGPAQGSRPREVLKRPQ